VDIRGLDFCEGNILFQTDEPSGSIFKLPLGLLKLLLICYLECALQLIIGVLLLCCRIFLVLQLVSVIEFITWWNNYWMPDEQKKQRYMFLIHYKCLYGLETKIYNRPFKDFDYSMNLELECCRMPQSRLGFMVSEQKNLKDREVGCWIYTLIVEQWLMGWIS
jgi:hypothetical protein